MKKRASVKNRDEVLVANFVVLAPQLFHVKAEFVCSEASSPVENVSLEWLIESSCAWVRIKSVTMMVVMPRLPVAEYTVSESLGRLFVARCEFFTVFVE